MHWIAYLEMEPPEHSNDYRTAMICAQIHNAAGKSYKKNITPDDILGKRKVKPVESQTAQEQKEFLKRLRGD